MRYRIRYGREANYVRLPMLLPGAITVYDGKAARVIETTERDNGDIAVVLDVIGGKVHHVGGPPECEMPVFTDPYPVCSCHIDPWPCNDAWALAEAVRDEWRKRETDLRKCHACGQTKNLGGVKYVGTEHRRYCRRVACVREYERANRDAHNLRQREWRERKEFAEQMNAVLGDIT